jgi:hypothetical protein
MKSKVLAKWLINIGERGKLLVKPGAKISEGEVLAKSVLEEIVPIDVKKFWDSKNESEKLEILESWKERKWQGGEIILTWGKMFGVNKILAPGVGRILTVDEFGTLMFAIEGEVREIKSPVAAKLTKGEKDKITLEFRANEYLGKGLVLGKIWAEMDNRCWEKSFEIGCFLSEKVILVGEVDNYFWEKAQAVGVAGVICQIDENDEEVELGVEVPVLGLVEKEWQALKNDLKDKQNARVLLNSKSGRLLLVLE